MIPSTIGVSSLLTALAILLPHAWGQTLLAPRIDAPFTMNFTIGGIVFGANDLLAMVVTPLAIVALEIGSWALSQPRDSMTPMLTVAPQTVGAILLFPATLRVTAWLDGWRLKK